MFSRNEKLQRLCNETFDLLVIGGGATGAGISLDAATRGLQVALVEAGDFASGTSSSSTKLIHGGVRYLESALVNLDYQQISLVIQSLKERYTILKIAPHLVRVIPIVIPVHSWFQAIYYLFGMKIYELLAGKKKIGRSSYLSTKKVMEAFPMITEKNLKGGVQLFDGQFDDARMNLSIILKAEECGATVVNYMEAIELKIEAGNIKGVLVKDHISGKTFSVSSKVVVNAAGPLSDQVRRLDPSVTKTTLVGSIGSHIIIDGKYTPLGKGLLIPKTNDGRVLFLLPWKNSTLVGTTDISIEIARDPKPSEEEIKYLLDHIKRELGFEVKRDQIKSCWAGIRPLVSGKQVKTSLLFRGFKVIRDPSGMYSILGGKWTSYRKMAEMILDEICEKIPQAKKCVTEDTLLFGGEGYFPGLSGKLCEMYGLEKDIALNLSQSYGGKAEEVIKLSQSLKDGTKRLVEGYPYLQGEIAYGVRNEMACTALDILHRRTRLADLDREAACSAIPIVINSMAKELGWNQIRQNEELMNTYDDIKYSEL